MKRQRRAASWRTGLGGPMRVSGDLERRLRARRRAESRAMKEDVFLLARSGDEQRRLEGSELIGRENQLPQGPENDGKPRAQIIQFLKLFGRHGDLTLSFSQYLETECRHVCTDDPRQYPGW